MQHKTPEERLLELIENPAMKKRARREAVSGAFDAKAFSVGIEALKTALFSVWSLRCMNMIIAGLCAVGFLVLMTVGQFSAKRFDRRFEKAFDVTRGTQTVVRDRSESFALAPDARGFRSFSMSGISAVTEKTPQQERLSRIALVGIIEDRGVRQAVLEDSDVSRTVVVREGDRHEGFFVKSIGVDVVTLTDGDRVWEIR